MSVTEGGTEGGREGRLQEGESRGGEHHVGTETEVGENGVHVGSIVAAEVLKRGDIKALARKVSKPAPQLLVVYLREPRQHARVTNRQ